MCGMRSRISCSHFALAKCKKHGRGRVNSAGKRQAPCGTIFVSAAAMSRLRDILWADCLRALRRAGFVCAAESPAAVVLVNAGRSVFLQRVPALNENAILATLRGTRLSAEEFLALLGDEP